MRSSVHNHSRARFVGLFWLEVQYPFLFAIAGRWKLKGKSEREWVEAPKKRAVFLQKCVFVLMRILQEGRCVVEGREEEGDASSGENAGSWKMRSV
jgi:hypothetical protein